MKNTSNNFLDVDGALTLRLFLSVPVMFSAVLVTLTIDSISRSLMILCMQCTTVLSM